MRDVLSAGLPRMLSGINVARLYIRQRCLMLHARTCFLSCARPFCAALMKRRLAISAVLLVAVACALVGVIVFSDAGPRVSGAMRQDAYVWQRAWTQPVRDAVSAHATNFSELVLLRGEITWNGSKPELIRVGVDKPLLAELKRPVGLALRVGTYPGPFTTNDPAIGFICDTAAGFVADARTNGIVLAELQLDFDCASSKLDGYRVWVEAVQRRVAPVPVTITALPNWLRKPAFANLAACATNYVLQVHSAERPKSFEAQYSLCEPQAARRAVERAGRIGVPFRVALPTYGYDMAFDQSGQFISLAAEGPRPNWPTNAFIRRVESQPAEISALIREWTANRPQAMRGVIWYRMPVATDKHNWDWRTLDAVMQGRDF